MLRLRAHCTGAHRDKVAAQLWGGSMLHTFPQTGPFPAALSPIVHTLTYRLLARFKRLPKDDSFSTPLSCCNYTFSTVSHLYSNSNSNKHRFSVPPTFNSWFYLIFRRFLAVPNAATSRKESSFLNKALPGVLLSAHLYSPSHLRHTRDDTRCLSKMSRSTL